MPGITAILHTQNDELRIARAIESLRSCDEVLVIDHQSSDPTGSTARRFGARILNASNEVVETKAYLHEARNDWVLCLHVTESLSEALEASIFEWKLEEHQHADTFAVAAMEETEHEWILLPPETRLVHRATARWQTWKPRAESEPSILPGYLMRLKLP